MWSSVATMLAIAIASNLDNAGVGIAYGVRRIRISWFANGLIAVISGAATLLAGLVGRLITRWVPAHMAAWIGAAVMLLVGLYVFSEPWRSRLRANRTPGNVMTRILRNPLEADMDGSLTIGVGEALILGIALAINALAGGFDAGIVHIGVFYTALLVALFSYLLLGFSAYIGSRFVADVLGNKATYMAGILLILIGIHQLW